MALSRQFRSLCRLAVLWAVPWALAGMLLAIWNWLRDPVSQAPLSRLPLSLHLAMTVPTITALGVISGVAAGLVLSLAERGREVGELSRRRAVIWGILGGMLPLILIGGYGIVLALPVANLLAIMLSGALTAAACGAIAGLTISAAKRAQLARGAEWTVTGGKVRGER